MTHKYHNVSNHRHIDRLFNRLIAIITSNLLIICLSWEESAARKGLVTQKSFSLHVIKNDLYLVHDDVIKWKHFPRYWPFVRGMPVNSPHKGQWRRNFDVFFDLRLNNRLSKQSWGCWFETLSRPLWRQCNVLVAVLATNGSGSDLVSTRLQVFPFYNTSWVQEDIMTLKRFPHYLTFVRKNCIRFSHTKGQ